MATSGFDLNSTPQPAISNVLAQKLRAERIVKTGASWFLTIAGLSMVNSILSISGTGIRFIFGLGIAEFVDALAKQAGSSGVVLDLVINGFVAGIFVLFWNFARKGQKWAFWVGMILYAIDAVIVALFHDYLAAAFHAYALYRLYMGLSGVNTLQSAEAQLAPANAPIVPR